MKIYAQTSNKDYFDQFVGTDYWVECEDPSSTHGFPKYHYYKFSRLHLGGYSVNSISSEYLTYEGLSNRFNWFEVLNQIQGRYMYDLNMDQVSKLIPTGNIITTDEIYEMLRDYGYEDIRNNR